MPLSKQKLPRTLLFVTMVSIGVLSLALLFVTKSIEREVDSWQWVLHTREVLERLQIVIAATNAAEAAQRGYLLSGSEQELGAYRDAAHRAPLEIEKLKELTVDNPLQQKSIQEFRGLISQRLARLEYVLQQKSNGVAPDSSNFEIGRRQKAAILRTADAIAAEEQRLLRERESNVARARQELVIAVGAVFVLSISLLFLLRTIAERDAERLRAESAQLKMAQQQLVEGNQLLEKRVQERTERIAEANAELQAFAHTVAHDLRAPLRNVEGFAMALWEDESERLSDQGKLFTNRIRGAVARMDQLIIDLLAYSRLARSELTLQQVDVAHAISIAQRDLERQIDENQAEVAVKAPLPVVRANEAVLIQVLSNLLSNALKFVEKGKKPKVCMYGNIAYSVASIFVEDNGIGIDSEHRERVFGVFERLHGQEQYPGTGIGLAIVKKGVERMGGSVNMESLPEGGTRFEIRLPVAG